MYHIWSELRRNIYCNCNSIVLLLKLLRLPPIQYPIVLKFPPQYCNSFKASSYIVEVYHNKYSFVHSIPHYVFHSMLLYHKVMVPASLWPVTYVIEYWMAWKYQESIYYKLILTIIHQLSQYYSWIRTIA